MNGLLSLYNKGTETQPSTFQASHHDRHAAAPWGQNPDCRSFFLVSKYVREEAVPPVCCILVGYFLQRRYLPDDAIIISHGHFLIFSSLL